MTIYHGECDACGVRGDLTLLRDCYQVGESIRLVCVECDRLACAEIRAVRERHQRNMDADARLRVKVLLLKRAGKIADPPARPRWPWSWFRRLFGRQRKTIAGIGVPADGETTMPRKE